MTFIVPQYLIIQIIHSKPDGHLWFLNDLRLELLLSAELRGKDGSVTYERICSSIEKLLKRRLPYKITFVKDSTDISKSALLVTREQLFRKVDVALDQHTIQEDLGQKIIFAPEPKIM